MSNRGLPLRNKRLRKAWRTVFQAGDAFFPPHHWPHKFYKDVFQIRDDEHFGRPARLGIITFLLQNGFSKADTFNFMLDHYPWDRGTIAEIRGAIMFHGSASGWKQWDMNYDTKFGGRSIPVLTLPANPSDTGWQYQRRPDENYHLVAPYLDSFIGGVYSRR